MTTVPAGTAAGLHHVVATGTTSQRTAQIELTVAVAGTSSGARLASTGADPAGLLGLVAALLVAGAAMVATPRVRTRR
ncbi:hypothetical protein GXP71_19700 [Cellulomonas sp. H30R-01]|nr:hypothetical protein GXP71_19700 [Cellulomonas sp. H30R-01]